MIRVVRAIISVDFLFPEPGRNSDAILKEWFDDPRYPLDGFHAYRDGNRIGNSSHCISYRELSPDEIGISSRKTPVVKDLNLTDTDWQEVSDVLHDYAGVKLSIDQCKAFYGNNIQVMCEIKLNGATDTESRGSIAEAFSKALIGRRWPTNGDDDDMPVFYAVLHDAARSKGYQVNGN